MMNIYQCINIIPTLVQYANAHLSPTAVLISIIARKRSNQRSFEQLPKIYGPMCTRFSPINKQRPQTNHSSSLEKPRYRSVPQRKRYHSKTDLQGQHKVQFKQSFFRGLPPIPQASEQQPQPNPHPKKIYKSTNKSATGTNTIHNQTPHHTHTHTSSNKRTMIFDTDLSNQDQILQSVETVMKLRPPKKKKHHRLTSINFTETPLKTTNSLFASSTDINVMDEETEFVRRRQVDGASALKQLLKKSIRSDVFRIRLPENIEEIPLFIKNYRVVNPQLQHITENNDLLVIPYKNLKALYFGEGKPGKIRDGLGVYLCQTCIFEGRFSNDSKLLGVQINHEGIYCGNFKDNRRNGQGQFEWYNGESYTGNWVDNLKHGQGTWCKPNGQSYVGQWKNNTIEGKGKYTFEKDHYYEGDFVAFLKHGNGFQRFTSGQTYEGQYKQGFADGKGKYYWTGTDYYEGEWRKGMREGYGKQIRGINWIYQGQFFRDKRHGHGELTQNQEVLTGSFQYNEFIRGTIKNIRTGEVKQFEKSQKPSQPIIFQ